MQSSALARGARLQESASATKYEASEHQRATVASRSKDYLPESAAALLNTEPEAFHQALMIDRRGIDEVLRRRDPICSAARDCTVPK